MAYIYLPSKGDLRAYCPKFLANADQHFEFKDMID
jgi:hypothetical protein